MSTLGSSALTAVLGYAVVFLGIVLLMVVITIAGAFQKKNTKQNDEVKTIDLGNIEVKTDSAKKAAIIAAVLADLESEN